MDGYYPSMRYRVKNMARNYTNTSCSLYGTRHCRALNMESCDKCIVREENCAEIVKDIDTVLNMLPESGIYPFFSGDECMLCKGEKKNRTECYAMADLGNPEPKRSKTNFLGMKSKAAVGSILPVQFSCCNECRKRYSAISGRHTAVTIISAIVMFALLNYKPIGEAIANVSMALPLILFAAVVGGAWIISTCARRKLIKKYSEKTHLNVMDIPGMDELAERNWFELNSGKGVSHLIFSKEPLKRGLLTGPLYEEENI